MLTVKTFVVNPLEEQCYVVSDKTKEAVIIDCGCSAESEWNEIKSYINKNELFVKHLLNTHLHFDHVWGTAYAYRDYGLRPEANYEDLQIYEQMDKQTESVIGIAIPHPPMPPLGTSLLDGSKILFGETTLNVISTPGHTLGGICFYDAYDRILFSGDTLFCGSCGRTDLEGGNTEAMLQSLSVLASLPEETVVYCGHGPSTTIGHERRYNPYLS